MSITNKISSTEIVEGVSFSGPLGKKSSLRDSGLLIKHAPKMTRFYLDPSSPSSLKDGLDLEAYMDIARPRDSLGEENPELALLGKDLEKRTTSFRSTTLSVSSRIKLVSKELQKMVSLSRINHHGVLDRTQSAAAPALNGLKFISKSKGGDDQWHEVAQRFDDLTHSTYWLLHRTLFWKCIGMKEESEEFAGVLFDALARRRKVVGDSINKLQLKEFWDQICVQSFEYRLQIFFDMVDKDADGRITKKEIEEIISLSASANKLPNIQKQAHEYAALIMEEFDVHNLGYIMIEELEMLLLRTPDQSTREGESRNLSQNLKLTCDLNLVRRVYYGFKYFLLDYWRRIWILLLWICVMAGLFTWKYIAYRDRAAYDVMGHCVSMAKGAAETLKLNMALILLPVCRNTITWLRNKTGLGTVVPFNDNLGFHKVIAVAIVIGTGVHAIYHLTCDFPRLIHSSPTKYYPMVQYFGKHPTEYSHFLKSFEGISGIIMVVLMAIAFTLATPWFRDGKVRLPKSSKGLTGYNSFWYSHHLFVIVYGLLIAHGFKLYLTHEWYKKTTWMYLAVPMTLYACERLTRTLRSRVKPVKIRIVAIYPGDVLALHMSKPQGFKYKSGQYMFVKCPDVSPFEWHPFSITSAPKNNHLSVHIRQRGDWTTQLHTLFSKFCQPPAGGKSGLLRAEYVQGEKYPFPKVLVDGPYGAPAQDYKKYDVVLLVGLGIGATPMISIVKDIVNDMKAVEEQEHALENGNRSPNCFSSPTQRKSNFQTKKAYFYWVTKEQGSFDWFKGIMNEVAEADKNEVIEMHAHCTNVYEKGDARSALIAFLQLLSHAKKGVDIVSGTRVKCHFARPKWRTVYSQIARNHTNGRVGVFYCGEKTLIKELKDLSLDFSRNTTTKFEFHKENF